MSRVSAQGVDDSWVISAPEHDTTIPPPPSGDAGQSYQASAQ